MGYLFMLIGGIILLVIGSVGVLALVASGIGVPLLIFPVAWYFMHQNNKKTKQREMERRGRNGKA